MTIRFTVVVPILIAITIAYYYNLSRLYLLDLLLLVRLVSSMPP